MGSRATRTSLHQPCRKDDFLRRKTRIFNTVEQQLRQPPTYLARIGPDAGQGRKQNFCLRPVTEAYDGDVIRNAQAARSYSLVCALRNNVVVTKKCCYRRAFGEPRCSLEKFSLSENGGCRQTGCQCGPSEANAGSTPGSRPDHPSRRRHIVPGSKGSARCCQEPRMACRHAREVVADSRNSFLLRCSRRRYRADPGAEAGESLPWCSRHCSGRDKRVPAFGALLKILARTLAHSSETDVAASGWPEENRWRALSPLAAGTSPVWPSRQGLFALLPG